MNSRTREALAAVAVILFAALPEAGDAAKLFPEGDISSVGIEISGNVYRYFPLTRERPLVVRLRGPATFEAIARWRFEGAEESADFRVELLLDGAARWQYILRSVAGKASYPEEPSWRAGDSERLAMDVPPGEHVVELRLLEPAAGALDVNLLLQPHGALPWELRWEAEIGLVYDDNVFGYSDDDIDEYLGGSRTDRYPMESVDDALIEPSLDLRLVRDEPGRRLTELRFSVDWHLNSVNGEKSYSKLGLRFRETRRRVAYLDAQYSIIPRYHIRHLWDPDRERDARSEYASCDFRKDSVRLELGTDRRLPVDVAGICGIDLYWYEPGFVEYETTARVLGLRATVRPASGFRLSVGYTLRAATARGYDEIGETRRSSDDSDTTYDQDEYRLDARWGAVRLCGVPAIVNLGVSLKRRFYLTEKSADLDPYHSGREDTLWRTYARVRLALGGSASLEGLLEFRRRDTESPYLSDIDDVKDYLGTRIGVRLAVEGAQFLD